MTEFGIIFNTRNKLQITTFTEYHIEKVLAGMPLQRSLNCIQVVVMISKLCTQVTCMHSGNMLQKPWERRKKALFNLEQMHLQEYEYIYILMFTYGDDKS